jgi:hypothetical protein
MAEIRVERKKSSTAWVWVLLAIILIAAVVWYLTQNGYINLGASQWLGTTTIAFAGTRRE